VTASLRSLVAAVALAATALAGCGQRDRTSTSAPTAPPSPSASAAPLVSLPAEGLLENATGKVVVRRLDGVVASELSSMQLDEASSPAQPPRLLAADGSAFRLSQGRLQPESPHGDTRFSGDGPPPQLPLPKGIGLGHWRYAFGSAGTPTLAQWSGECELPVAYEIVGGRPVGLGAGGAPVESVALGVSLSGAPIVLFPRTACGNGEGRVGVYIRNPHGDWQQVTTAVSARYFRRSAPA
jgi:hypothetical protein